MLCHVISMLELELTAIVMSCYVVGFVVVALRLLLLLKTSTGGH